MLENISTRGGAIELLLAAKRIAPTQASKQGFMEIYRTAVTEPPEDRERYGYAQLRLAECLLDGLRFGNWPVSGGTGRGCIEAWCGSDRQMTTILGEIQRRFILVKELVMEAFTSCWPVDPDPDPEKGDDSRLLWTCSDCGTGHYFFPGFVLDEIRERSEKSVPYSMDPPGREQWGRVREWMFETDRDRLLLLDALRRVRQESCGE